jgi:hypothetical protein
VISATLRSLDEPDGVGWRLRQARLHEGRDGDLRLIFNSWIKSYQQSPWRPPIAEREYCAFQHHVITSVLRRSKVLVACSEDSDTTVGGYIVTEAAGPPLVVHFIFVKHDIRKEGLARFMADGVVGPKRPERVIYTHQTRTSEAVAPRLFPGSRCIFNPYLLVMPWPSNLRERRL